MKVTIKNDHPVPMEVVKHGVILQPGESVVVDVPDDKPAEAPAKAAAATTKTKGDK